MSGTDRERAVDVVVCRGCCCGHPGKHPDVDHAGQLARLRALADERPELLRVRTSECLGPCAEANVLVVVPSRAGRRRGGRPRWLVLVRDVPVLDLLAGWVRDGGPGIAPLPDLLALHEGTRPAAVRAVPVTRERL